MRSFPPEFECRELVRIGALITLLIGCLKLVYPAGLMEACIASVLRSP